MKTNASSPEIQAAKPTKFYAVKNVQWRGRRYKDTTFDVAAADLKDALIVAWRDAGWIEEMRDGQRVKTTTAAPVAPTAKKIPQTLSAELPLGKAVAAPGRGEFVQLLRSLIDPAPYNPRKNFREGKLQELADSIKTDGIIEPLIVRPVDGGRFEIVAGERRWRASGLAWPTGKPTLPCIVRPMDKVTAIRVQGIENLLRDDLNAMEEAGWYDTLKREGGYTVKDIVRETGLSEPTIYARLMLLNCPPEIQAAVADGRVPASTAEKVARVDDAAIRTEFARAILHPPKHEPGEEVSGVLSFRQAMRWLEGTKQRAAEEADWKTKVQGSPLAKTAAKVLSVEESRKVVGYGYVKDPQKYVRPIDVCPGDPKQRTYAEVAQAAGRELPAPIVACDGMSGRPMAILPRAETEKALDGLMRSGAELERLRKEETTRRERKYEEERKQRKEDERQVQARAKKVALYVQHEPWSAGRAERLLRFAVGGLLSILAIDEDDHAAALREMGVPVQAGEVKTAATVEWRREYLDGCDAPKLHAWLMWFAIRDGELYSPAIDEDRLWDAEILLGLRKNEPRTSVVEEA